MQFPVQIREGVTMRPFAADDTEAFYALIHQDWADFNHWLRWTSTIVTMENAQEYIARAAARYAAGDGFHAGLWMNGALAGGIAVNYINRVSNKTEIGYWLGRAYRGHGLVTAACRLVLDDLFTVERMHRVEIQAAADNLTSRAVAERLGFTLEGIKRESEWISDHYRDHALYSLLDREWQAQG